MVKRTKLLAVAVLVGTFVLGALAGSAATYAYAKREQAALIGPGHPERRLRGLERRLHLTTEQSQKIQAIFAQHQIEMERLKRDMFEGCGVPMRQAIDAMDDEIRAVLTPEQRPRFEALLQEREQRGWNGPPGRGPRGPGPYGPGRRGRGRAATP